MMPLQSLAIACAASVAAFQVPQPSLQRVEHGWQPPGTALAIVTIEAARSNATHDTLKDLPDDLAGVVDRLAGVAQAAVDSASGSLEDELSDYTEGMPVVGDIAKSLNNATEIVAGSLNSTIQKAQDYLNSLFGTPQDATEKDGTTSVVAANPARFANVTGAKGSKTIQDNLSAAQAALATATKLAVGAAAAHAEFKSRVAEAEKAAKETTQAVEALAANANITILAGTAALKAVTAALAGDALNGDAITGAVWGSAQLAAQAADEAVAWAAAAIQAETSRKEQIKKAKEFAEISLKAAGIVINDVNLTIKKSNAAAALLKGRMNIAAKYVSS